MEVCSLLVFVGRDSVPTYKSVLPREIGCHWDGSKFLGMVAGFARLFCLIRTTTVREWPIVTTLAAPSRSRYGFVVHGKSLETMDQ